MVKIQPWTDNVQSHAKAAPPHSKQRGFRRSLNAMITVLRRIALMVLLTYPALATAQIADSVEAFATAADHFISGALDAVGVVPGVAVAVVHGDDTVYLRGFGLADREADVAATPEALFYIASSTKSFTALAAVLLDARGELDLDASLAHYLPMVDFDPAVKADSVTLRHLITHTAGLDNDAIVFRTAFSGDHTLEVLLEVMNATTPSVESLGVFSYTNLGYNILSFILDRETGMPWQDLLREMIFEPLGMDRTTAYASLPRQEGWPVAAPYFGLHPDGVKRLYLEKQDNTMQAAGGTLSTAADLARWIEVQLNDGRLDGRQVFPEAVIRATHQRHAKTDAEFGPFKRGGYGLGWYVGTYQEDQLLHHFGSFAGFRSHVSFMPEHDLGVAVVVNEGSVGSQLADLFATFAYDWWLGKPDVETKYAAMAEPFPGMVEQQQGRIAADLARRAERQWTLSAPLEAYTGTYVSLLYGTLTITIEEGVLAARIGNLHAVSTPYTAPNTIRVEFVPFRGEVIGFELGDDGKAVRARYDDAVFERKE